MSFEKESIVTYFGETHKVIDDTDSVIILESCNPFQTFQRRTTIPVWGKSYKEIRLHLPTIFKKL